MINFIDNIHAYKNGSLSEEEKLAFEKEMLTNPTLKDMVGNFDLLNMVGEVAFEEETKGMINRAIDKHKKKPTIQKTIRVISIAASITLVGYFGVSQYQKNVKLNQRFAIVMEDHIPPQVVHTRSGNDVEPNTFLEAKEAFSQRDYDKSKRILLSLELTGEQEDEKNYLLAHIYFYNKQLKRSQKSIVLIKGSKYLTKVEALQTLLDQVKN